MRRRRGGHVEGGGGGGEAGEGGGEEARRVQVVLGREGGVGGEAKGKRDAQRRPQELEVSLAEKCGLHMQSPGTPTPRVKNMAGTQDYMYEIKTMNIIKKVLTNHLPSVSGLNRVKHENPRLQIGEGSGMPRKWPNTGRCLG